MAKNKLQKFAENLEMPNVFQPSREEIANGFHLKGKWHTEIFKNENPIILELGCGKGEYSVGLGTHFKDKNFIGIDIKGNRFWTGAKQAIANSLDNICFMRTQIELIDQLFSENEIDEIWITFPDPQIKFRRAKHRLTHPEFLAKYKKILKPNGLIHLKTDSEYLHGYTHGIIFSEGHKVLVSQHNIYNAVDENIPKYVKEIQTFYEKIFLNEGKKNHLLTI